MKQVIVLGYFGAGNVGDELLGHQIKSWLRSAGFEAVFVSNDLSYSKKIHPDCKSISRYDLRGLAEAMTQAEFFVLGGGGIFHEHYRCAVSDLYDFPSNSIAEYGQICLMARQFGLPIVLLAQGVGPLYSGGARQLVADIFSHADFVSVRDAGSALLLQEMGVSRHVETAPDPIWSIDLPNIRHGGEPHARLAGVVVRDWSFEGTWQKKLASALKSVLERGWQIRFINYGNVQDAAVICDLRTAVGVCDAQIVNAFESPLDAATHFLGCDAVIAMRLHALIVGARCGLPLVALEYDQKVSAASIELKLPQSARISLDDPEDRYQEAVAALCSSVTERSFAPDTETIEGLARDALIHRSVLFSAAHSVTSKVRQATWNAGNYDWLRAWASQSERHLRISLGEKCVELARSDRRREHALAAVKRLEEELALEMSELAHARSEAKRLEEELALEKPELAHARSEAKRLEEDYRLVGLEQKRWERRAKELEASRSWRITSPLRWISRLGRAQYRKNAERAAFILERKRSTGAVETSRWLLRRLYKGRGHQTHNSPVTARQSWSPRFDLRGFIEGQAVAIVSCAFQFDELVNQRPINLAKHLSSRGYRVVFVAWQWTECETLEKSNSIVFPGIVQLSLFDFLRQLDALTSAEKGNTSSKFFITFPAEALLDAARILRSKGYALVYDIMDEWEEFEKTGQAPWYRIGVERQVLNEADVISAVSRPLIEKFTDLRRDILLIPNGLSEQLLGNSARNIGGSASFVPHTIVAGYFGHLTDAWFDWVLVLNAAALDPDIQFEIIGYGAPRQQIEAAKRLKNVTIIGPTHPSELKTYTSRWNVALIPFKEGALARAVDPIKIYEYLYMGLPVVVTGIAHLKDYPGTEYVSASEDADFAIAIRRQANSQSALQSNAEIDRFLEAASWTARFDKLISYVDSRKHLGSLYAKTRLVCL